MVEKQESSVLYYPIREDAARRAKEMNSFSDYKEGSATAEYRRCVDQAVEIAKHLIRTGADIVTDTNMALSGVNKKVLEAHGGMAHCFMADEEVAGEAKERKVTRAVVSMEHAAKLYKPVIFAIGNAPTALIRLYELICDGIYRPAFIIGVPVGFVNVEVAKEMILHTDVPCIVNRGRKGGSNVAAAICNALLYEVRREDAAKKVD